jgi:glucose/arabinose dehydrogenase
MRSAAVSALLCLATAASAQDAPAPAPTAAPRPTAEPKPLPIETLKLPPGFKIAVFAYPVPNARSMVRTPSGTIFVGSRAAKKVYAVVDKDGDFKADSVTVVASGLVSPNGVEFKDGALYVGDKFRILRYDKIEERLANPPEPVVLSDNHPDGKQHGHKYMRFGPDGWLYFSIGAPCNICDNEKNEPRFASILRMQPDGKGQEIFAHGVRNSVGFDWHPKTNELWFTDNGRDNLTENFDEIPNDELDRAPKKGMHFGYPFCHQGDIPDPGPEVTAPKDACAKYEPPVMKVGPHVAALGMRFYRGSMFPPEYREAIFMAQHGSWNRTPAAGPIGYRVMVARPEAQGEARLQPFIEGWLQGKEPWGKPVDVLELPDGSLLISDDRAGAIYRVTYDASAAKK